MSSVVATVGTPRTSLGHSTARYVAQVDLAQKTLMHVRGLVQELSAWYLAGLLPEFATPAEMADERAWAVTEQVAARRLAGRGASDPGCTMAAAFDRGLSLAIAACENAQRWQMQQVLAASRTERRSPLAGMLLRAGVLDPAVRSIALPTEVGHWLLMIRQLEQAIGQVYRARREHLRANGDTFLLVAEFFVAAKALVALAGYRRRLKQLGGDLAGALAELEAHRVRLAAEVAAEHSRRRAGATADRTA